jgi:hypothetical protein
VSGDLHVAVISARRPHAVPAMLAHLGDLAGDTTWYVGAGESDAYRAAGAAATVEAGALCPARNAALDDAAARGRDCLQLSDDLRWVGWAHGRTADSVERLSLRAAAVLLGRALADAGPAELAGVAPTANAYFAGAGIQSTHFVVGDLMLVRAGCPLRFDETLLLKEDYDYTCQHLARYGRVARVGRLLASFAHRSNPGGAVAYRTAAAEQAAIARLMARWPNAIAPNPRRANEVLLRWKKRT